MTALAVVAAALAAVLLARFTPMRAPVALLLLAIAYIPLSFTQPGFNGISLLGALAALGAVVGALVQSPAGGVFPQGAAGGSSLVEEGAS